MTCSSSPMDVNKPLFFHLSQQYLNLIARKRRKHLAKLLHLGADRLVFLDVLLEQGLVGIPVKSAFSRVDAGLAEMAVESSGEKQACCPATSMAFNDFLFQKMLNP